jgi:diguanylate cyclase
MTGTSKRILRAEPNRKIGLLTSGKLGYPLALVSGFRISIQKGEAVAQTELEAIEQSWNTFFAEVGRPVRDALHELIEREKSALADFFYERMLQDELASQFLSTEVVREKLHVSMQQWLSGLFSADGPEHIAELVAQQMRVGEVHARAGISVSMIYRGARLLRGRIFDKIGDVLHDRDLLYEAVSYVSELFDHALEAISAAYNVSRERGARTEESFRLFSVSQNLLVEKERQRAALLDWENQFVYFLASGGPLDLLPKISSSDFGLWFLHKGEAIFDDAAEMPQINRLIAEIDGLLQSGADPGQEHSLPLMRRVQEQAAQLKYLLNAMFERIFEFEAGRDALTHLLNRRFLPVVLSREIVVARRTGKPFSMLMVDIDSFKKINDTYGHAGGDSVLQQVSAVLLNSIRVSDYVFRYGGEEFLMMLAEVGPEIAMKIAEKIRQLVENEQLVLPDEQSLKVTISVGVAVFDGHPDYEEVIKEADQALYAAKNRGKNCCVRYRPGQA